MTLNTLKSFYKGKKKTEEQQDTTNTSASKEQAHFAGVDIFNEDMLALGEKESYQFRGDVNGMLTCMQRIALSIRKYLIHHEGEQEKFRIQVRGTIKGMEAEKDSLEADKERVEKDQVPRLKEKIKQTKEYIHGLKNGTSELEDLKDKSTKVSFVISMAILIALSVYLFVFYSSASYSAFFRDFTPDKLGLSNAIFDPRALSIAWKDGIMELILILSMPFIFFGLGFLIHKFMEEKKWQANLKIVGLVLGTFIFDYILALHITRKIYEVKREMSFDDDIPPFNVFEALQSEDFWMIIFAGFLVYIIWGFLLEMVMKSYDGLNKRKHLMSQANEKLKELEKELNDLYDKKEGLIKQIQKKKEEIIKNTERLNGIIIPMEKFSHVLQDFVVGWTRWMSFNNATAEEIRIAKTKADEFVANSITELNVISLK